MQDIRLQLFENSVTGTTKRLLKTERVPNWTWKDFSKAFMDKFLLESVREQKAMEFERLRQDASMTVNDYVEQFVELSRYAPYLVGTE